MREIKFRAWDGKNKIIMAPSRNLLIESYDGTIVWSFGYDQPMSKDWSLMQYTGLKDKNGKEIYEGDILNLKEKKLICPVEWDKQDCMFVIKMPGEEDDLYCAHRVIYLEEGKVIGNIYENPELLESK